MTVIEKEFFETFGIEPKDKYIGKKNEMLCNHCEDNCYGCSNKLYVKKYPPITPEIVLELIKILLKSTNEFHIDISKNEYGCNHGFIGGYYQKTLEQSILSLCIEAGDEIQDQVKALFNA